MFDLTGRRALVTGSSQGIGEAIAIALASRGADIVIHGLEPPQACDHVTAAIEALGRRAAYVQADLRQAEACADLSHQARSAFGGIDILVSSAAVERPSPWREVTPAEIQEQWALNFQATLLLAQGLAPAMAERGWGRIVALGSIQQARPNPHHLVYAATKSALSTMISVLARDLGPSGVTANVLAPGAIETDRNAAALSDPAYKARVIEKIPAGRIGQVGDCVGAAVMLASDEGAYINGETLFVDGGWRA
ncbi:MAG: SDR family oxidoreductase [Alphaproteobacteria bacterium]|nr:SDR family oxidoreductase [Alphaproteobacteria bacterium]MBU2379360.1 SDR family oxidoreductase [Alphaproteobacteria bacterium]